MNEIDSLMAEITRPAPHVVTGEWLAARSLCSDWHISTFTSEFGDRAIVTRANLLRAAELGLDTFWLGREFLTGDVLERFRQAVIPIEVAYQPSRDAEVEAVERSPAGVAYLRARSDARDAFHAIESAPGQSPDAIRTAREAHHAAIRVAADAYQAAAADLLAKPPWVDRRRAYYAAVGHALADSLGLA